MFFIGILVIHGTELLLEVSEPKITELCIFWYVEDELQYFLTKGYVAWFVFLENCEFERKST